MSCVRGSRLTIAVKVNVFFNGRLLQVVFPTNDVPPSLLEKKIRILILFSFQIQTAILNPSNVAADPETLYFTDEALLERVPTLMLILSGIYLSVQVRSSVLVRLQPF